MSIVTNARFTENFALKEQAQDNIYFGSLLKKRNHDFRNEKKEFELRKMKESDILKKREQKIA